MASPAHGVELALGASYQVASKTCEATSTANNSSENPSECPMNADPLQLFETQSSGAAAISTCGLDQHAQTICSNTETAAQAEQQTDSDAPASPPPGLQIPAPVIQAEIEPEISMDFEINVASTLSEAAAPQTTPELASAPMNPPISQTPPSTNYDTFEQPLADTSHPTSSSPLSESVSLPDVGGLLDVQTSPEAYSSPVTRESSISSPLSELDMDMDIAGHPIEYDYDGPPGHRLLRLKPTPSQWADFPALLSLARHLRAENDGCFKIILPGQLREPLPEKAPQKVPANAYRVRQIRQRMFWQVSTVRADGVFSSSEPEADASESVDVAIKNLKALFNKNKERQMRNVRYRVDVPAWTARQRREAGVPERSPIHPLKGDKLDYTKAIIPGIHTPYVYESGPYFGATFQFHAEDFRLASLNHLYKGRKIWIVIPATAVDVAEKALNRKDKCSQFMRHRAEFFFPERLQKMGIPYRIVDQRPGETIVILPDAYHEGFSTGYTIAEAKNYADPDWTADKYKPCQLSCQLATAIPAEFMRIIGEGEQRLDLCADYGDGMVALQHQQQPLPLPQPLQPQEPAPKRNHEEDDTLAERNAKQPRVC